MTRVVVLDDFFPDLSTGFRLAEFGWMLRRGVIDDVYTTARPYDDLIGSYSALEPHLASRVHPYDPSILHDVDLASIVFLNNGAHFIGDLQKYSVPFVLTLYPGGGLDLGNDEAHAKLEAVVKSPLLRRVITTQPRTTEYVRSAFGTHIPLTEIPGVVVDSRYFVPGPGLRSNYYPTGSPDLTLGFVAHRYSERGLDKGFPAFVEAAQILADRGYPVRAVVVGGFDESHFGPEVPADLQARFDFHGVLAAEALREVLLTLDVVVSPNRPGVLTPMAFDGFPTGSAVEASLCGAAMVVSDELGQNRLYRPGFDIEIVSPSPLSVADTVEQILRSERGIAGIAKAGLRQSRISYGIEAQLKTRRQVIEEALAGISAESAI